MESTLDTTDTKPTVLDTRSGQVDGLNRCPHCGSTDIAIKPNTGKLECHFCHTVYELGSKEGPAIASDLIGERIGSGAASITQPDNNLITIKCQGCGAEVTIDVDEKMSARCHWCRQVLSIENQIPNGAVPDLVLPFLLSKEKAQAKMSKLVRERRFYALPRFRSDFSKENIVGVYLPYLVVDANVHASFKGQSNEAIFGIPESKSANYLANIYDISREFDLLIDDLTIEARSEKREIILNGNTNYVINAILPFDIENAVPYNGNYLKGFNSERRDTGINELRELVNTQIADIVRYQANDTATKYDGGINWTQQDIQVKGMLWKTAYLPIWLYSFLEVKRKGKKRLHFVATNARTGETVGAISYSMFSIVAMSFIIELIALTSMIVAALVLFQLSA